LDKTIERRKEMKIRKRVLCIVGVFIVSVVMGVSSPCLAQLKADIDVRPKTLGNVCKSEMVKIFWDLDDEYVPNNLTPTEVIISNIGGYTVSFTPVWYKYKPHYADCPDDCSDSTHLLLKYKCSDILNVIKTYNLKGEVVIEISGTLADGTPFVGWDDIHVKRKRAR
jgi:hypothetical protein